MFLWKSYRWGPGRNLEPSRSELQSWWGCAWLQPPPRGSSAVRPLPWVGAQFLLVGVFWPGVGGSLGTSVSSPTYQGVVTRQATGGPALRLDTFVL